MTNTKSGKQIEQRRRPLVWVREIVLFKSLDPLDEIRRLPFGMGLNVIQGESSESSEGFESGHGIGKTTVCRLIRYCLGEKTYGQKHIVAEVRHCVPSGYVGAIIEVDGVEWSLLRSLGSRGKHYAKPDTSIEDLPGAEDPKDYASFTSAVETAAFKKFPKRDVLSSGQSIQWLHLLAMCSRDQESRYDRYWNWRHQRSETVWPRFNKPKVDAGLCLRTVLGLLDPTEPQLRARLEELEHSLPEIRKQIAKKELEPSVHISQLRNTLTTEVGVEDAADAPIEPDQLFSVSQAADRRLQELIDEVATIDEELEPLDSDINLATASLRELSEMADQQTAASDVTTQTNDQMLDDLQQRRQSIDDKKFGLCPGGGLVGDCSRVQERIAKLDQELVERRAEVIPEVAEREQVAAELSGQSKRQQTPIDNLRQKLKGLNKEKNKLLKRQVALNQSIKKIPTVTAELRKWNDILNGTKPNTALNSLKSDESNAESEIESTKGKLDEVITQQSQRAGQFEVRFNDVVQRTINREFKGEIEVADDGVDFRISRENSLSGEAYETLAVLLADIALLLESSSAGVHHPGLLLHDSPREADLNLGIYERLLETASSLMQESRDGDDVPFQYIVTTTTPPSDRLKSDSVTMHGLSGGEGSLFGMQLEVAAAAQGKLFEDDGNASDSRN